MSLPHLRCELAQMMSKITRLLAVVFLSFIATIGQAQAQTFDYIVEVDVAFDADADGTIANPEEDFSSVNAGQDAQLLVRVVNNGPDLSPATTISFELPGRSTFDPVTDIRPNPLNLTGEAIGPCVVDTNVTPNVVTCDVPQLDEPVMVGAGEVPDFAEFIINLGSENVNSEEPAWIVTPEVLTQPNEIGGPDFLNNRNPVNITIIPNLDMEVLISVPCSDATLVPCNVEGAVQQGSTFPFTVSALNNGPFTADTYEVTVTVPNGIQITDLANGCSQSGNEITCDVRTPLAGGGQNDFVFEALVIDANPPAIQAGVDAGGIDRNQENDTAEAPLTVSTGTDLFISKAVTDTARRPVIVGDIVEFTLSPEFIGAPLASVTVTDDILSTYTFVPGSLSPAADCSFAAGTISCTFEADDITGTDAGTGVSSYPDVVYELQANTVVSPASANVNVAEIGGAAPGVDPNTGNNIGRGPGVLIAPPVVDLAIDKRQPFPNTVIVNNTGSLYNFTLEARNRGNIDYFGDVIVTDEIPENVEVRTLQTRAGFWSCAVGGTAVTFSSGTTLTTPIVGPATIVCTATYEADDPNDGDTETGPFSAGEVAPTIVLGTVVTAASTQARDYANTARINGPVGVNNLPGNDQETVNFTAEEDGLSTDLATLKRGAVPLTNADGSYQRDGDGNIQLSTDTTAVTNQPYAFELEVTNNGADAVDALEVFLRDRIAVFNDNVAFDLIETRNISADANTPVCSQFDRGGGVRELQCNIGTVPVCNASTDTSPDPTLDACPVVTVIARLGSGSTAEDATVPNTAQADSRVTPDDNQANNDVTITVPFEGLADLSVDKTADAPAVRAGDELRYSIVVRNDGSGNRRVAEARNIVLYETLPANVQFISATGNGVSCSGIAANAFLTETTDNELVCELGNRSRNQSRTINIVVRPQAEAVDPATTADLTNSVRVAILDDGPLPAGNDVTAARDLNLDNNEAAITTNVLPPSVDIGAQKTDNLDPLAVNEDFEYRIRVRNFGLDPSNNVVITDTFPTTEVGGNLIVGFTGIRVGAGEDPDDYTCTLPNNPGITTVDSDGFPTSTGSVPVSSIRCERSGPIDSGDFFDLFILARSGATGSVVNDVEISSDEIAATPRRDALVGNDFSSENTTVKLLTDIFVQKVAQVEQAAPGETFNFVATVGIVDGFAFAEEVVFRDILPENMEFVGTPTPSVGSCAIITTGANADREVECALGNITPASNVTITIPVVVPEARAEFEDFTNNALVTSASPERGSGLDNNESSDTVEIVAPRLSGTVYRDINDNGEQNAADTGVEGVLMTLRGPDGFVRTTTTDENGDYSFGFLPAGEYEVERGAITDDFQVTGNSYPPIGNGTRSSPTLITQILVDGDNDTPDNDFTILPQPVVGLAKSAGTLTQNADGSFDVTYTFTATNYSLEAVNTLTISDTLAGTGADEFGEAGTAPLALGEYSVTTPTGNCGTGIAAFDGTPGNNQLVIDGSLAVGASCTMAVTVTVRPVLDRLNTAFVNQGSVNAVGVTSGTTSPTDLSDNGTDPDADGTVDGDPTETADDTPTTVTPNATFGLTMVKSGELVAADAEGNPDPATTIDPAEVQVGDYIQYTFTVQNTGNTTLTDIDVVDALIATSIEVETGIRPDGDVVATVPVLGPFGSATVPLDTATPSAFYRLTLDDLDNEQVFNEASATADDVYGGTLDPVEDDVTVPLTPQPGLTLTKTGVLATEGSPTTVGDIITFTFRVENTGETSVENIEIIDTPLAQAIEDLGQTRPDRDVIFDDIGTLEPGEFAVRTFDYAVVQEDINNGGVPNTATAAGTEPTGEEPVTDEDEVTVDTTRNLSLNVIKTQEVEDLGVIGVAGLDDVITYTITVTNDGNVPHTSVTIVDTLTDFNGELLEVDEDFPVPVFVPDPADQIEGVLAVGETATYEFRYTIDEQAVFAGGVSNSVLGTAGFDPGNGDDPLEETDLSDDGDTGPGDTGDDPTVLELAPIPDATGLTMVKTTPVELVNRGDVIPFEIVITNPNNFAVGFFDLVDRLPNGMIYIPGTATIDGEPADVTFTAGTVTWPEVEVPPVGTTTFTLDTRILNGTRAGTLTNRATFVDPETGERVIPDATASVRIAPDALFECSDIVGKVFNDVNGNGYQDAPSTVGRAQITDQTFDGGKGKLSPIAVDPDEDGLPNVRLATVDGTIITTDENGLFSVPCASLPDGPRSNYILKVDPRSLPAGYRMTTENPLVSTVSPGTMTEMNFGAAVALQVVRVDLTAASFVQTTDGAQMTPALRDGLRGVLQQIAGSPSTLALTFYLPPSADGDAVSRARDLLDLVEDQVRDDWRSIGQVRLLIEQSIMRTGQ